MENSLTEGPILKKIIIFAVPIMLGNLFQQLYNLVDSLIVGNYLGTSALAAVTSSSQLIFLLVSFFNGLAMGGGIIVSRYFGAKDIKNLRESIHTMIAFGIGVGLILTVIGYFGAPIILKWMNTPLSVFRLSVEYFKIYFLGALGFVVYNVSVGVLRSLGDSKDPLKYLIIASVINVILDFIFVVVLKKGVASVALATTIAQCFSAVLSINKLRHVNSEYALRFKDIKLHMDKFKQILKYGLPSGIQNSIISIANTVVQTNINSFGKDAIAGIGAYNKIEGFAFLPISSFSLALTTYVSQNIGAKEYERVKKGGQYGTLCSCLLAEFIGIIFFMFADQWLSIFGSNPKMIEYGAMRAHINTCFYALLAFSHSMAGIMRGAGKPIVPMTIMAICWCLVRVVLLTAILPYYHDISVVCWVYPITWGLSAIIFAIYYKKKNWLEVR